MSPSALDRQADWLTAAAALERILAAVEPLPAEDVPLAEALGRTLAESVVSPIDQPPWDNSGMDGFACRAEDVAGASPTRPLRLIVVESVPAGAFPSKSVGSREAVRLMTGAPLPAGADSVVRLEHTHPLSGASIAVTQSQDAGRNVRQRGEDVRRGEVVLEAGRVLRPADIGMLASVGHANPRVYRRARVAILSNGDELVDVDVFEQVLAGRRIVSSNSYSLAAAVRAAGARPKVLGIARDTRESLREHLARATGADILITTAGASVGDQDLVKDVLEELGFTLDFWRIKLQPGSPFSFGRLGDVLVFGLPGNPVSALVTFEALVRPAIRKLQGRREVYPVTLTVRTAERIESRPGLMRLLRATLEPDGAGGWRARLTGPQGSGILSSVSKADALLVLPIDTAVVEPGTELTALPLRPSDDGTTAPPPF